MTAGSDRLAVRMKRLRGARAIIDVVLRRMRRRVGQTLLVAIAVAANIGVVGALLGANTAAADRAIHDALAVRTATARSVMIARTSEQLSDDEQSDRLARASLAVVSANALPVVRMTWFRLNAGSTTAVAFDDIERWTTPVVGRLPQPCGPTPSCEAVVLVGSPDDVGQLPATIDVGQLHARVVGAAQLLALAPFSFLPASSSPIVLINGVGITADARLAELPRTSYWIATLVPERVHPWSIQALSDGISDMQQAVPTADRTMTVARPDEAIQAASTATAVLTGRIAFVGSMIFTMLLAFAAFAGTVGREDVAAEHARLARSGAGRLQMVWFVIVDAVAPTAVGILIGLLVASASIVAIASGGQTSWNDLIVGMLSQGWPWILLAGATLASMIAVAIGAWPKSGRFIRSREALVGLIAALAVATWDRATRGPLSTIEVAARGPWTVLVPSMISLVVIALGVALLPRVFTLAARASSRAPLSPRLAIISMAREPLRPAATMTLMTLAMSSLVVGLGYATTEHQTAVDQAAFATGMDVRIDRPSSDSSFVSRVIAPLSGGVLGPDVGAYPVLKFEGFTVGSQPVTVVGIQPGALTQLRGWRKDFAAATPGDLAQAISDSGPWPQPGHPLPTGVRHLDVTITATTGEGFDSSPVLVEAVIDTADGQFRRIALGPIAGSGPHSFSSPLFNEIEAGHLGPDQPVGWKVMGFIVSLKEQDLGTRHRLTLAIQNMPELGLPVAGTEILLSPGQGATFLRAPAPTDDQTFPAIVSNYLDLAAGSPPSLKVKIGPTDVLSLRPIAAASWFPTITDPQRDFAVVDLAPLMTALNAESPDLGIPNEMLVRTADGQQASAVAAAVSSRPFAPTVVQTRAALEAASESDPVEIGAIAAFLIGAIAGLTLTFAGILMSTTADLRDERGDLADLEEQGVRPATLQRLIIARPVAIATVGLALGLALGSGLLGFAAGTLTATPDGRAVVPPVLVVLPVAVLVAIVAIILVALVTLIALLARRQYSRGLLREAD
jgi:hypothetical protein